MSSYQALALKMGKLKHHVISYIFLIMIVQSRSECLPQKNNGDNDFHVLTVCAEIIMMKEKVIVILK